MSYSYEPNELAPAYRPLMFRNARTTTSAAENVKVDVFVWGVNQLTFRKPYRTKSGNDYTFDIDVQSVLARYIAPKTDYLSGRVNPVFPHLTNFQVTGSSELYAQYYINTYLEVRNASGLLETVTASLESSSSAYAIAASRPPGSVDLEDYYYNGSSAAGSVKWMTDGPTAQDVGISENFSLCHIAQQMGAYQFKFYNNADSLYATVTYNNSSPSSVIIWRSISCGPVNLGNFAQSVATGSDAMPSAFSVGDWYTITAGENEGDASAYQVRTVEHRLNIVGRCDHALRLEWVNSFGAVDQYTFEGEVIKRHTSKGNIREVSLPWDVTLDPPYLPSEHGLLKTGIESLVKYEIKETVRYEDGPLMQSLARSPEVLAQLDGVRYSIAVEDSSNTIDVSREGTIDVEFSVIVENEITLEI